MPARRAPTAPSPQPVATASRGVAESELVAHPTLEIVQRYAAEHNPAVRAAFHTWRQARERITVERSYENPLVGYSPDTGNMSETRAGPLETGIGFVQAIPFPGKLTVRGRIADQEARAQYEQFHATAQEVARQVWQAYADFYLADRSLDVNQRTIDLIRQFESIAQSKYRVGQAAQADVILAQEELSRLATERIDFTADLNRAQGSLNALLDRAPRAALGRPGDLHATELKATLEWLVAQADRARPELRAQDHLVKRSRQSLLLARMGYLPDFTIGGQYTAVNSAGTPGFSRNGHDIWTVTLGFSIPIWVDRVQAGVDEAKAGVMREKFRRRDLGNVVSDQVQKAYEFLMAQARNERIYRTTLIPQTRARIAATRAGYQTGRVDFLSLIDSLKSFEDIRLLRFRSIRGYQRAAADLERAVGQAIPGISK